MSIWVLELFPHQRTRLGCTVTSESAVTKKVRFIFVWPQASDATFTKWPFSPPSVQSLVTKGLYTDGCFRVVSCVGDFDRVLPLLGSSGSPRMFKSVASDWVLTALAELHGEYLGFFKLPGVPKCEKRIRACA